jgi:hypothetical protein
VPPVQSTALEAEIVFNAKVFQLRHETVLQHVQISVLINWIKIKFTLVQVLKLCTGRAAHSGRIGTALLFLDHGTRRE